MIPGNGRTRCIQYSYLRFFVAIPRLLEILRAIYYKIDGKYRKRGIGEWRIGNRVMLSGSPVQWCECLALALDYAKPN